MRSEQFQAMGTTIALLLPTHAAAVGTIVARTLFASWERMLSRFRPESELSRLNRQPGVPVPVSPLLYQVLATALEAAHATVGLFDPAMYSQIVQMGYDRSFELLPTEIAGAVPSQPLSACVLPTPLNTRPQSPPSLPCDRSRRPGVAVSGPGRPCSPQRGGGWRGIRLDPERRPVTLPTGTGVDLGGIAKGLAVDATLARFRQLGIGPALVNAGGDLAVTGTLPTSQTWPIAIPVRDESWTLELGHGAVATSGRARRRWRQSCHERHHILDPRTGESAATSTWSVTVVAGSCTQAEVAAKVAFLLGPDAGVAFLETEGLAGLIVDENGTWRAAGPWPASAMCEALGGAR
jgi:thiamine biosynthesis lipoprotein